MSGRGRAKKAKLGDVLSWIEGALDVKSFDDVSNNGLQIARDGEEVSLVAFAVDGSAASVKAAAAAGAQLLVVHHGISWGGGIRRIVEGDYAVVKAALDANVALAAYHLPLDANRKYGNNWELARYLGLRRVAPAFTYRGNVIGVTGYNAHGKKPSGFLLSLRWMARRRSRRSASAATCTLPARRAGARGSRRGTSGCRWSARGTTRPRRSA